MPAIHQPIQAQAVDERGSGGWTMSTTGHIGDVKWKHSGRSVGPELWDQRQKCQMSTSPPPPPFLLQAARRGVGGCAPVCLTVWAADHTSAQGWYLVGGKQDGLLGWAAVTEVPAGVGLVPAVPHLGGWEAMGKVRVAVGPISGVGCTAKLAPAEGRGKADGVGVLEPQINTKAWLR